MDAQMCFCLYIHGVYAITVMRWSTSQKCRYAAHVEKCPFCHRKDSFQIHDQTSHTDNVRRKMEKEENLR
jgi:hypothetical protein